MVERAADAPGTDERVDHLAPLGNGGMAVSRKGAPGAREARLAYRTLAECEGGRRALLEVRIATGVKHQIRCQLAHIGLPVVGDFRYGHGPGPARPEPVAGGRAILLHAWRQAFEHPGRREPVEIAAEPPAHWREFLGRCVWAEARFF
jgi:23S rRNA pseudouridine1911/1915/1917 synthase